MFGAFLGDIIGSPFEFDGGRKTKNFELFTYGCRFTDDSVMTAAVGEALLQAGKGASSEARVALLTKALRQWGRRYPHAGYGGGFRRWLRSPEPQPYMSCGNGSAMRVSAAGWLYDTLEETRAAARDTALPTHNHPEGIKGAEATAAAVFLARTGASKEEIRDYTVLEFGHDLSRSCEEIRSCGVYNVICQNTVPEAITAFLEGESFEDCVRTAVSLGGDTDTLAAITGAIAEAFYGVPEALQQEARRRLPADLLEVAESIPTLDQ